MAGKLRIITGLILFAYAGLHLINVALGLHSIELMDRARPILMAISQTRVGSMVLLVCLLTHAILGLMAIYRRNTFRMDLHDTVQILAALCIIPLLIPHMNGTAMAKSMYDLPQSYEGVVRLFWLSDPGGGIRQVLLVAAVWIHGCIGFFTWMRLRSWWPRGDVHRRATASGRSGSGPSRPDRAHHRLRRP